MEKLVTLQRPDGDSPLDLAAGVRKPRSGSSRKPRSGSHALVAADRDPSSPLAVSPSGSPPEGVPPIHQEDAGHLSAQLPRDVQAVKSSELIFTNMSAGDRDRDRDRDRAPSFSGEKSRDTHTQGDHFKGYTSSDKMGDGESRSEWKMFQRREKRRDNEWSHDRHSNWSSKKNWKESDGVTEKNSGKDETRRAGSPEYERMKKLERTWKERGPEKGYKDSGYRDKSDYHSKSSSQRDRGSYPSRDWVHRDRDDYSSKDRGYRYRGEYSSKDRDYRYRDDRFHSSHKDWGSREYSRDRDYQKPRRAPDSRDSWKSRDGADRGDSFEKHPSQQSQNGSAVTGVAHGSLSQNGSCVSMGGNASLMNCHGGQPNDGNASLGSSHSGQPHNGNASSLYSHGSSVQVGSTTMGNSASLHERKSSDRVSDYPIEKIGIDARPPTKLKLKVGGVTHTIHSDGRRQSEGGRTSPQRSGVHLKKPTPTSAPEPINKRRQRLILQENSDDDDGDTLPSAKEQIQAPENDGFLSYLAHEPRYYKGKAVSKEGSLMNMSRQVSLGLKDNANQPLQGVRKSSRIPKKRVLDGEWDEEVEPKSRRRKKVEIDSDEDLYHIDDEEDDDTIDEADDEVENVGEDKTKIKRGRRRKRVDTEMVGGDGKKGGAGDAKLEVPGDNRMLTARQRALQSNKEGGLAEVGPSLIEFPDGLTQSVPKKQKENLTAAERQLKKEEAARKRRQQVEKTAKEIQAVAMQKILSQDSQRKKREVKLQKQREEMEQEKKAAAMAPASNSIRWILGPTGNIVSFSQDLELPSIFSGPCSYPPARERCAGPSCNNAYRYRDSKTLLPLCSLQCYRAVQKPAEATLAH